MEEETLVCVRLDYVQRLIIGEVLAKSDPYGELSRKWKRLQERWKEEALRGQAIYLTIPARMTDRRKAVADLSACDMIVLIQLLARYGHDAFSTVWQGLYEAVEWGYASELALYEGYIDLSTIAGRKCLSRNMRQMEKLHSLPTLPAPPLTRMLHLRGDVEN